MQKPPMETKPAMKASDSSSGPRPAGAPGRPAEIEEPTNRYFVHPVSRALVDLLIRTRATPNQVSVASVFMAATGAACYIWLPWPVNALAGLAFQFVWHVLDGADGDLARRTGRASNVGELVDGVCDHLSQVIVYVALVVILHRSEGWGRAWAWACAAGLSHFLQANAYETGRKTYRRWVYGAGWMRQNLGVEPSGGIEKSLGAIYLAVSSLFSPGERAVEAVMDQRLHEGGATAETARTLYRDLHARLVSRSAILSGNSRTIVAFLSVLAGNPLWFFVFEITVQNLALLAVILGRGKANQTLVAAQAASAPN
jgi:phosphatidylglycerophosphate synthase